MLHRQAQFARCAALPVPASRKARYGWHDWPQEFRDLSKLPAVAAFAREAADEVAFHLFAQWLADRGLEAAHHAARDAGMALGLISDLAVGVAPSGADAWSFGRLHAVGARRRRAARSARPGRPELVPDDVLPARAGRRLGFCAMDRHWRSEPRWYIRAECGSTMPSASRGCGVVVPRRRPRAKDGAYLTYPFTDLLRLLALESHRKRAFVVAEDLGTAPHGFHQAIVDHEMPGMRVLWFEREGHGAFRPSSAYDRGCMAMTGTHDTPTVAGWWRGTDIGWGERLGRFRTPRSASSSRAPQRPRTRATS